MSIFPPSLISSFHQALVFFHCQSLSRQPHFLQFVCAHLILTSWVLVQKLKLPEMDTHKLPTALFRCLDKRWGWLQETPFLQRVQVCPQQPRSPAFNKEMIMLGSAGVEKNSDWNGNSSLPLFSSLATDEGWFSKIKDKEKLAKHIIDELVLCFIFSSDNKRW